MFAVSAFALGHTTSGCMEPSWVSPNASSVGQRHDYSFPDDWRIPPPLIERSRLPVPNIPMQPPGASVLMLAQQLHGIGNIGFSSFLFLLLLLCQTTGTTYWHNRRSCESYSTVALSGDRAQTFREQTDSIFHRLNIHRMRLESWYGWYMQASMCE